MNFKMNGKAQLIIEKIEAAGFKGYVVGGCVRDSIMGLEPNDWDITTNAKTEDIMQVFKGFRIIETGIKHGTVTIVIEEEQFEVTTYRVDGIYTDGRRPESVEYTESLKEDLARRDFTINSIAYNTTEGFKDYFGGIEDINNKIIRCVGVATDRFEEDSLRIMRALRFSSVLSFEIDKETEKAINSKKDNLSLISKERLNVELVKLLNGDNVEEVLIQYKEVIGYIIPELKETFDFEQNNMYHKYNIWEHTVKVVKHSEKGILRLAALFHDIGKPETYTFNEGQGHFYGHAVSSERITEKVMRELKFPNTEIEQVLLLVKNHDMTFVPTKKFVLRMLNKMGEESLKQLFKLRIADIIGQGKAVEGDNRLLKVEQVEDILYNLEEDVCFSLKDLKLNGSDLKSLGIPQGKVVGTILNSLLELVIEGEVENEKEELIKAIDTKIVVMLWDIIKGVYERTIPNGSIFEGIDTIVSVVLEVEGRELIYNNIMGDKTSRETVTLCSGEISGKYIKIN